MREINLNGYIDEEIWFGDELTPNALHEELYGADGQLRDDVHIRLNSFGGSCNAATRMCDDVRAYPGNVHITISGTAASAATVLAMAADNLDMTPGSLFMIHDPSVVAWGNERELMESINLLRACKESIINTYMDRCQKSRQEIAAMMSAITWMDAQSAVAEGFVDAIAESLKPGAAQNSVCERQTDEERRAEFRACRDEAEKKVKAWLERRKPHKASHAAQNETSTQQASIQTSASPLNGKTVPESIPETVPKTDGTMLNAQTVSEPKAVVPEAYPKPTPLVETKAPIETKTPVAQLQKRLGLIMPTRR